MNESPQKGSSRIWLIATNAIALAFSALIGFVFLILAGFSSDNGTNISTYLLIGMGLLFPIAAIICSIATQTKKSWLWAILSLLSPLAIMGIILVAGVIIGLFT